MTNPDTLAGGVKLEALLPCPFCGNEHPFLEGPTYARHVTCNNHECQASVLSDANDAEATATWNTRASPPKPSEAMVATHRHVKRGTEYVLIGYGKMQAADWHQAATRFLPECPVDGREVAIYRSVDDGSLWVRPREEFEDGRFIALAAALSGGAK